MSPHLITRATILGTGLIGGSFALALRKFATDLKKTPLVDLCYLGGWKDAQTVLKCYMQPDEAAMRDAITKRSERRVAAT